MKLNAIYPRSLYSPLRAITRQIIRISEPEKVLLLSAGFKYFLQADLESPQEFEADSFDLLILTPVSDQKRLAELGIRIMREKNGLLNYQFTLMNISVFNEAMESGESYWSRLLANAMLVYDNEHIALSCPPLFADRRQ